MSPVVVPNVRFSLFLPYVYFILVVAAAATTTAIPATSELVQIECLN